MLSAILNELIATVGAARHLRTSERSLDYLKRYKTTITSERSGVQRQQRYGWLRTKRVFEALLIFAFSNDEDLRVDAKIQFNISVTSENLLSEEKIDSSILDAVNLTHLEPVELYFHAANILSKDAGCFYRRSALLQID